MPDVSYPPSAELYQHSDIPLDMQGKSTRPLRNAAVLIPLVHQRDQWHLLFIRRAEHEHDRHSGQVAFPGGAEDLEDLTPADNALRETEEEVGIKRDAVKVVATLKPYLTISNYRVTPVVGLINWPCTMRLQNSEVARAFTIPLNWLRDSRNFRLQPRHNPNRAGRLEAPERRHPVVYFNEYDGEILWGATARMTLNFLRSVDQGEVLIPSFSQAS